MNELHTMILTPRKIGAILGIFFFATQIALGQIQSGAPIRDFRLPKFNDNGRLEWDLSGETGTYISREEVEVTGVMLRVFSDEAQPKEVFQMQSQRASVFLDKQQAQGFGSVYGVSEGFAISGEEWRWDATTDHLVIEQDVRVIFELSLSRLLK